MVEAEIVLLAVFALAGLGATYWVWVAAKLGSRPMLILGIAGPAVIATAPVGLYMLLFGVPDWVLERFGGPGASALSIWSVWR